MNVQQRRGMRGAIRATPEDILQLAIARHRALRDRERLRAGEAAPAAPSGKAAPPRKTDDDAQRAQFATAMARSVFGRFYQTEHPKKNP
jgi:hypothetical protein